MFYKASESCQIADLSSKWEDIFGRKSDGVFVEIGAYDGDSFSNTSCLADVGWSGVYVEPISEFAERCRLRHTKNPKIRIVECAISDQSGNVEIFVGGVLTTLLENQVEDYSKISWAQGQHAGEKRQIETHTLDEFLASMQIDPNFDLLVVDVEGAEDKVIKGFDMNKWSPKVIVVELEDEHPDFINNDRVKNSGLYVRKKLERAGYDLYYKDYINSIYLLNGKTGNTTDWVRNRLRAIFTSFRSFARLGPSTKIDYRNSTTDQID